MVNDLLRRVQEVLRREGAEGALRVRVRLGALAHCTEEGLRGRWSLAVRDTALAQAQLDVDVSHDLNDPRAQSIVLEDIVLNGEEPSGAFGRT